MNISLPETLKRFAKARAEEGGYSNPSDYVRALIRDDRKTVEKEKLDQMLLEGLASGDPKVLDEAEWESIRTDILARAAKKNKTK